MSAPLVLGLSVIIGIAAIAQIPKRPDTSTVRECQRVQTPQCREILKAYETWMIVATRTGLE